MLPFRTKTIPTSSRAESRSPDGLVVLPRTRRVKPPRLRQRLMMSGVVSMGVLSMVVFIVWFADPEHIGNPWLFWPLTLTLFYKFVRILYEWYHYVAIDAPVLQAPRRDWKVDMITTYVPGEPYEMLINTLKAMKAVEYPHEVYLCDEGNDPYLQKVCAELGVHHVYRGTDKTGAKAGNINYCLEHHATGEIVAILDPDHEPLADFLDRVLGYFEDPEIGFVQTIQAYSNRNESFIAKAAAQQTYHFYGPIQMGMHHYGTAQAIGANCVFRRAALDSIDGHAPGLAEDLHTSMQLHAKGWRSVYVPEQITRGLVPADLPAYYKQQLKWARGVFELWFFTLPKLFGKLTWRQRIHYSLLPMYYLVGFVILADITIPAASLFMAEVPWKVDLVEFGLVISPVIIISLLIRQFAQRWVLERHEQGFHLLGGVLRNGTWWVFIIGFVYTLLRIRVPYIPTPKENENNDAWGLSLPNIAAIAFSVMAIIIGLNIDWSPYSLAMAGFSGVNVAILCLVVLMGQQKTFKAFYRALYGGSLTGARQQWFKIRTGLLFPLLRKGYVILAVLVATTGLVLSFTIFKPPMRLADIYPPVVPVQEGIYLGLTPSGAFQPEMAKEAWPLEVHHRNVSDTNQLVLPPEPATAYIKCRLEGTSDARTREGFWQLLGQAIQRQDQPVFLQPVMADTLTPEQKYQQWYELQEEARTTGISPFITWVWKVSPSDRGWKDQIEADWYLVSENEQFSIEDLSRTFKTLEGRWMLDLENASEEKLNGDQLDTHFTGFLNASPQTAQTLIEGRKNRLTAAENRTDDPDILSFSGERRNFSLGIDQQLRGVSYFPSEDWQSANKPLTRYRVRDDFLAIKKMGANAVRRYYASIYDYNVLAEAEASDLGVLFGFHIDANHDFYSDSHQNLATRRDILSKVADFHTSPAILAWVIGDEIPNAINQHFQQPYRARVLKAFAQWVNLLSEEIHQQDEKHPVVITAQASEAFPAFLHLFATRFKAVDMLGVNAFFTEDIALTDSLMSRGPLDFPYFYSSVTHSGHWAKEYQTMFDNSRLAEPSDYEKANHLLANLKQIDRLENPNCRGAVVYTWQDRLQGTATWYGITDYRDRRKPMFYALQNHWTGSVQAQPLADTYISGPYYMPKSARYKHQYVFPVSENLEREGIRREWYICREELLERVGTVKPEGKGDKRLRVTLPAENSSYRIYLHLYDQQGNVSTASYPIRRP